MAVHYLLHLSVEIPYLLGWYALRQHPELFDDLTPTPYFVLDLVSSLSPTVRRVLEWTSEREYSAVYIGPQGSLSALHRDYWNTHFFVSSGVTFGRCD